MDQVTLDLNNVNFVDCEQDIYQLKSRSFVLHGVNTFSNGGKQSITCGNDASVNMKRVSVSEKTERALSLKDSCSMTLQHAYIGKNGALDIEGGAIHLTSLSDLACQNCTLEGNKGNTGGAIYCDNSSFNIRSSYIFDNVADIGGSGYCTNTCQSFVASDVIVTDNVSNKEPTNCKGLDE
eukprot:TRINITY_DN2620_c0_g1_i2.p1 TRINITY_DN2620_c0_g1~~TRINITY_DN2620_c0_g1_i2.p1  ORF type:complete len:180 (+),score=37.75 TRINITY_DN2620_c0_g1_i2:710-1249(+)